MNSKHVTLWFLFALLLLFAALALIITLPFLRAIAAAVILSVIFYPLYEKVLRWTGHRPIWASLITTLIIIVLFMIPISLLLLKATNEAISVAQRLGRISAEQGGFGYFLTTLLERPLQFIGRFVDVSQFHPGEAVRSNIQRLSLSVLSSGAAILGSIARVLTNFFFMLILVFFMFAEGEKWAHGLAEMMPLSPEQSSRLFRNITDSIIGNVYGMVTVGFIQGLFTGIAVAIVGLPSPLLLGIVAFFASILPVIGAAMVWLPAGLYLIFTGAIWKGLFVLAWGAVVISAIDNVVRPWVVSGKVELHALVLMFVILGGVQVFGFLGLFLGPVVASVLAAVFKMLREEVAAQSVPEAVRIP